MAVTRPRFPAADEHAAGEHAAGEHAAGEHAEDPLSALLRARGLHPLHVPTTRILPPGDRALLDRAAGRIGEYDWVVVTSARAAAPLVEALARAGVGPGALPRVCAVGPGTAEALRRTGISVDLVPDRFLAEGVVEALLEAGRGSGAGGGSGLQGARVLLPRAEEGRDVIPSQLGAAGARVDVAPAYRTEADPEGAARLAGIVLEGEVDVLTFAAGSAARSFAAAWRGSAGSGGALPAVPIAAIGPATATVLVEEGMPASRVGDPHTLEGLADAALALTER